MKKSNNISGDGLSWAKCEVGVLRCMSIVVLQQSAEPFLANNFYFSGCVIAAHRTGRHNSSMRLIGILRFILQMRGAHE